MDEMNYNSAILVRDKTKSAKANLFKIRTFDNEKSGRDVEDPYQRGEKAFEACYQILHQCCHNFLDFLEKKS
jgi:protein-tyrosine-phosphatase